MKTSINPTPVITPASPTIDDRRRAPWLLTNYSADRWTVADTLDPAKTSDIDFTVPLADGTPLRDAHRLYATVKEYAWWVRDPRYSRIDDATTHATMVRNLVLLAHALSLRGLHSFALLQPYDVEQLVEECRYGVDAVLRASDRVEAHLATLAEANLATPLSFGGLPRYPHAHTGRPTGTVFSTALVTACNLPPAAARLPRVSTLIARAAEANGLRGISPGDRPLEPLPNITVQALQRWLDPLEQLHSMRHRIEAEAIGFKPFPHGAARIAAIKGVGTSRTPIPPPKLTLHLLEQAAIWVTDRRDTVLDPVANLRDARRLATACWILIAAFTARRDEEIDALTNGCLEGDEQDGWWLDIYIEKTLQRQERIPVPGLVATAVNLMMQISEPARQRSDDNRLFQWQSPDGRLVLLDVGRHLDDFASVVGVPDHRPRGGSPAPWHWHPHQFRRFFAVLYFHRFDGARIEALSHHLRHFNLEMTRRYVTQDPEVAALWTDVEWGYMGQIARSIAAGERSVAGAMGERLKKTARRLVDLFRRKLQVASPDRIGASMAIIMQRQGLVITPKPWVTCSCPRTADAALVAACRRLGDEGPPAIGPDFARAGPTVCPACPYAIIEGNRRSFIAEEANELEAVACTRPREGTVFGELEALRIVDIRRVDARFAAAAPLERSSAAIGQELDR